MSSSGQELPEGVINADPTGGWQRDDSVQSEPAMDMNPTTDSEKVQGIVAQTRADHAADGAERIADVLRQRLSEAGIDLADDEVTRLAQG